MVSETFELEFTRAEGRPDASGVRASIGMVACDFAFRPTLYRVRRQDGTSKEVMVPWDRLTGDLEALRNPRRDPAVVARVGEMLREVLEAAGWDVLEAAVQAAAQGGRRVQVVIRSETPEIHAIPWEMVSFKASAEALGMARGALVRYEGLPLTKWRPRGGVRRSRGRILVASSMAGGVVPVHKYVAAIASPFAGRVDEAVGDATSDRGESVVVLNDASLESIEGVLRKADAAGRPFECLHLVCHGVQRGSAYGLALDGGDIEPAYLQRLAPFADTLRLVVIAACDGANEGRIGTPVMSAAQVLHRLGIGAVIASRFPLSVQGSIRMTEALYQAILGKRWSLDEAFVAAREALRDAGVDEWSTLQLLWRGDDLELWRLWSSPLDVEVELRALLERDEGGRALAAILARPGYLGLSQDLPVVEGVAQALVQRGCRSSSLGEVFSRFYDAASQLLKEHPQHFFAGLVTACELVEHLAPSGSQDLVTKPCNGDADFEVETHYPASLDIIVAREGGHRSFLELCDGALVGRGRIAEPAFGPELRRDPDSIAQEFVRYVARELGLDPDPRLYGGIDKLASMVDKLLEHFMVRTPEGTPGLSFCPRYVDVMIDGERGTLTEAARRQIKNRLRRLQIIARRSTWSNLDEALISVLSLYERREKR